MALPVRGPTPIVAHGVGVPIESQQRRVVYVIRDGIAANRTICSKSTASRLTIPSQPVKLLSQANALVRSNAILLPTHCLQQLETSAAIERLEHLERLQLSSLH